MQGQVCEVSFLPTHSALFENIPSRATRPACLFRPSLPHFGVTRLRKLICMTRSFLNWTAGLVAFLAVATSPWVTRAQPTARRAADGQEVQQNSAAGPTPATTSQATAVQENAEEMKIGATASAYHKSIQPLLIAKCVKCHGPEKQKGGLRLDEKAAAFMGGDSGEPAIVPGHASASRMMQLVTSKDDNERMPPEGESLTPRRSRCSGTGLMLARIGRTQIQHRRSRAEQKWW